MLRKKANDGQNMRTAEPNKYPLARVPDPSRSSPPPMRPTSRLGRSRPPGTSGRDLLGLGLMAPLAETSLAPGLSLLSGGLGLSHLRPRPLPLPSVSAVDGDTESPQSRMLCTSIKTTLTPAKLERVGRRQREKGGENQKYDYLLYFIYVLKYSLDAAHSLDKISS